MPLSLQIISCVLSIVATFFSVVLPFVKYLLNRITTKRFILSSVCLSPHYEEHGEDKNLIIRQVNLCFYNKTNKTFCVSKCKIESSPLKKKIYFTNDIGNRFSRYEEPLNLQVSPYSICEITGFITTDKNKEIDIKNTPITLYLADNKQLLYRKQPNRSK